MDDGTPFFYEDGLQPQNFSHRNFSGDHHKSNDCDTFSVALLVWAVESEKTNKTDHGPLSTPDMVTLGRNRTCSLDGWDADVAEGMPSQ